MLLGRPALPVRRGGRLRRHHRRVYAEQPERRGLRLRPGTGRKRGPELFARLRALRPEREVLYISGHADESRLSRDVDGAPAAFLAKPLAVTALVEKVSAVLAGHATGRSPRG